MTKFLEGEDDGILDVVLDSGIDVNDGSLNRILMEGMCEMNILLKYFFIFELI